jgi:hypothetical protein
MKPQRAAGSAKFVDLSVAVGILPAGRSTLQMSPRICPADSPVDREAVYRSEPKIGLMDLSELED